MNKKPKLKLSGMDGNAFMILGAATRAMKKAGLSEKYRDKYRIEATSGDYDHLLQVTMTYCEVE